MAYLGSSTGRSAGSSGLDDGDEQRPTGARSSGTRSSGTRSSGARSSARASGAAASGAAASGAAASGARSAGLHSAPTRTRVASTVPDPGRSYAEERDWARLATLGGGIAVGVLLGASVALLFAPATGEDTRELLLEHARAAGGRVRDRFDDLRDDVRWATRRSRRGMRRGLARGGWALEDAYDRASRRLR